MNAPAGIVARPLNASVFAPYGDVLDAEGRGAFPINGGRCQRFDDIARLAFDGEGGRPGLSIFRSEPVAVPHQVEAMERHPLGSQAFIPLSDHPFLVIVAPDAAGRPGVAEAFVTAPRQGVNLRRNVWHAALAPLVAAADFVVLDRVGDGDNCEEAALSTPLSVRLAAAI